MTDSSSYSFKPGLHSHNYERRIAAAQPAKARRLTVVRFLFLLVGLGCIGYYGYTVADQNVYQAYENWAFDQQIAGRTALNFRDYLREQTPFGFLAGPKELQSAHLAVPQGLTPAPVEGSVIGRVSIGRLNLSAVVRQGVTPSTLSEAVGHVPSTALAGQPGNFSLAAHRDTLFRALKDIQKGDIVSFQSPTGVFDYKVAATKIVKPTDVSVISPDGGGLINAQTGDTPNKLLTLITCYPFYYVGSAPKRFIVQGELVPHSTESALLNHQ